MNVISGGCACGAIRYTVSLPPLTAIHCQCRQCQRVTGAGHSSLLAMRSDTLHVQGAPKTYELVADSGNAVQSAFCSNCGSPVFKRSAGFPQMVFLHAGSLDDPALFAPQRIVWHASAQPWDVLDSALKTQPN
jgi:hypothetical protein